MKSDDILDCGVALVCVSVIIGIIMAMSTII